MMEPDLVFIQSCCEFETQARPESDFLRRRATYLIQQISFADIRN
jgi:hypothetical protein